MINFKININGRDVMNAPNVRQYRAFKDSNGNPVLEFRDNDIDEQECQVVTKEIEEGNE